MVPLALNTNHSIIGHNYERTATLYSNHVAPRMLHFDLGCFPHGPAAGTNITHESAKRQEVLGNIGYFGFKFKAASGAIQYGWGELDLNTGSIKEGVITKLVYDDTGAAVTVGVVPAPGALALLGAAGLVGARRRR